jgi:hypothetical protein
MFGYPDRIAGLILAQSTVKSRSWMIMEDDFSTLFPNTHWWEFEPPWFVQEVIVNWLDIEVDNLAEERMPILKEMVGFRNREVHGYVHDFLQSKLDDLAIQMYGQPHREGW